MTHLETTQSLSQAFGTGDIAGLLAHISDDIDWEPGLTARGVPWLIPGKGKDQVAKFFSVVGAGLAMDTFEVLSLPAGENQVAAIVRLEATIRSTGKRLEDTECQLWTFGPDGNVAAMRHFVDTAGHAIAAGVA